MTTAPAGQTPPPLPTLGDWQPLPNPGATTPTKPTTQTPVNPVTPDGVGVTGWIIRVVLALVMTAALGVGTWSIYTLLTDTFSVPKGIALLGCGLFDVAAILFALLSQQYATTTDSGLAPRLAMLAMVTTSSWVNWKHAELEQWGTVGGVIFASAPVIAELSFEMWHRFEHREALRRLGRVPEALPVLGKWAWIAHPLRARKTLDAHIKATLTEHEAIAEERESVSAQRARIIVQNAAPALTRTDVSVTNPPSVSARIRPLTSPERPALATGTDAQSAPTLTQTPDAHTPTERPALTPSPERAPDADAHTSPSAPTERTPERSTNTRSERAQAKPAKAERPQAGAQSAPSLDERKALKKKEDTLTLALYKTLNRRPEWTDIRDALTSAGLRTVSRPTAQRIRERVEAAHPDLLSERPDALTATS